MKRAFHWLAAIAREPLTHFVLLGFLLWSVAHYRSVHEGRYVIHMSGAERQRIERTFVQQFGQKPTARQLEGLINRNIREEIYLREALALNLEKDDEIVRRRIAQKYEFLQTDLAVMETPSATQLQSWFDRNRVRYQQPARITFSQVYFSPDREGDARARARAAQVLERLRTLQDTRAPALGDPFPGPSDLNELTPEEANKVFGESELTARLFELPVGEWSGPYRSGYGWHLIHVTDFAAAELQSLAQISDQVFADYKEEQRRLINERAFAELRARYIFRYDGGRP